MSTTGLSTHNTNTGDTGRTTGFGLSLRSRDG